MRLESKPEEVNNLNGRVDDQMSNMVAGVDGLVILSRIILKLILANGTFVEQ